MRFSFRSAPVERNVIYRRLRLPLEHSRFLDLFEHIRMFRTWVVRFQRFTAGLPFVARTSQLFHSKLLRKVTCFTHIISGTHDACRSKCVSRVLKGALARRLSIQIRFLCAQTCSRSTFVDPNAFSICSNVFSLDASRSKCVSYVPRCVLARPLSTQMCFLCAQARSR